MSSDPFPSDTQLADEHLFFVTGKLATPALSALVAELADQHGFQYTIQTLPITVAALMTPEWIGRHWTLPSTATLAILPGYCLGEMESLRNASPLPILRS